MMGAVCWTVIFIVAVLVLGYSLFKDDDWKR